MMIRMILGSIRENTPVSRSQPVDRCKRSAHQGLAYGSFRKHVPRPKISGCSDVPPSSSIQAGDGTLLATLLDAILVSPFNLRLQPAVPKSSEKITRGKTTEQQ